MRSLVHHPAPPSSPSDILEEWVEAGLITGEQANAIRQHEATPHERRAALALAPSPETGPTLVVEALGYLGGIILLVGATILVSLFWNHTSTTLRLVLIGSTAVALIAAGFAVPDRLGDAAGRLRSVLWAAGVVATAGFLGTVSVEVLDRRSYHALVVIGPATAVVAAVLWWLRPTWLQQLAILVPLMIGAQGIALELTSEYSPWGGAAMWGVAILWSVVAWAGWIEPRVTGVAFGMLGAAVGAMVLGNDPGIALGLGTAVAAVALALWERNLPWLGVGALILLWTSPQAANEWFPGRLSAALTLIIAGGALVGAAIWVARHQGWQPPSPGRPAPTQSAPGARPS